MALLFRFYVYCTLTLLLVRPAFLLGQPNHSDSTQQTTSVVFPDDWLGTWAGDLEIYGTKGLLQSVPMELDLQAIDTSENFIWAITYGPDKVAGRRAYELEIIDPEQGLYAIDEKNTIRLEAYLFQQKLFSRFEVMGNWLLCTYEYRGEELLFEIVSGAGTAVSTTGGQQFEGEDIPPVQAFPIKVRQFARLHRKK